MYDPRTCYSYSKQVSRNNTEIRVNRGCGAGADETKLSLTRQQAAVNHNRAMSFFLGVYHGMTILRKDRFGGWGEPNRPKEQTRCDHPYI